jgi:glycosyltransferase involved in cell wall biosynthesis
VIPKTALVHDWLVSARGGEKVLQAIYDLYPSPIYTLLKKKEIVQQLGFQDDLAFTSLIQHLPFSSKFYRNYFPLFPLAIERLDLSAYDLILSSSHAVAKGVHKQRHQLHICYCHSPMRYAWDLYDQYTKELRGLKKLAAVLGLSYMRNWDSRVTERVDHFIANSQFVRQRIQRVYLRDSVVIYPPVMTHLMELKKKEGFYLTVSHLVPYKKIDLIVEAFSFLPDKHLVVIGEGPEWKKVRAKAGKNVDLLGYQEDRVVRDFLSQAKGFVFAAEEDFGIAPVEAQASGTPVIAYGKGGVLETVLEGKTGVFFQEQTVVSLIGALQKFERMTFDPVFIKAHVEQFGKDQFCKNFQTFVNHKWEAFCESTHSGRR